MIIVMIIMQILLLLLLRIMIRLQLILYRWGALVKAAAANRDVARPKPDYLCFLKCCLLSKPLP